MKNNQNGITLVALVITIIILLILAGISIASLTDNGLFEKTEESDRNTEIAEIKEEIQLAIYEKQLSNLGTIPYKELVSILEEHGTVNYKDDDIIIKGITTEKGYEIPISEIYTGEITPTTLEYAETAKPAGSTIIETDAAKGIVMVDSKGNEWVWVEVPKTTVFITAQNSTDYDNIKTDLKNYATDYRRYGYIDEWYDYCGTTYDGTNQYSQVNYITSSSNFTNAKDYYGKIYTDKGTTEATEYVSGRTYYADITEKLTDTSGCGLSYTQYNENYKKMLSRVYTNGGFWISRYEIGDATATDNNYITRTKNSGTTGTAVSKADQIPYDYVTCSQAQTLASGMSTDSTKTSSLLFGIQWDLTCKFIEENTDLELADIKSNSTSWGNCKNSSLTLNRGKYNINAANVWIPYTTDTENNVINSQKIANKYIILTTGASEETNKMNIYDFAGNMQELTLEKSAFARARCTYRGSSYGYNYPASYRCDGFPTHSSSLGITFRSTLF